jgi:hypothetical protein
MERTVTVEKRARKRRKTKSRVRQVAAAMLSWRLCDRSCVASSVRYADSQSWFTLLLLLFRPSVRAVYCARVSASGAVTYFDEVYHVQSVAR